VSDEEAQAALLADYHETLSTWRVYTELRFKLLGLLPTVTAVGVGFLAGNLGLSSGLVSAGALLAVFGIAMYDLRNTMFYDSAIHRAKYLEEKLGLPRTNGLGKGPGLFGERPRTRLRFFGIEAWHDRALAIIYSASFAAWATVLVLSLCAGVGGGGASAMCTIIAIGAGTVAFVAFMLALKQYGDEWSRKKSGMAIPGPEGG
jgi:hypothetical protein